MNYTKVLVPTCLFFVVALCSAKEILHLKSQAEIDKAIKDNKSLVIDYHAEKTCGPCKQMAKILPDLAKEFPGITFGKVDVAEFDVAEIRSVPTFVLFKDGKEIKRFSGSRTKVSFTALLNEYFECC